MAAKRKRSDPQATRYRIAVTALAKAEKRQAAAERAVADLRRKVRGYERRLPPERVAGIEAGTKANREVKRMRKERWNDAKRTLEAAATVANQSAVVHTLYYDRTGSKRRYGLAVMMPEGMCLAWDFRDGFKTGKWADRGNRKALRPPSQPIEFLEAAE